MNRIITPILLGLLTVAAVRADTALKIDQSPAQRICLNYYDQFYGGSLDSTFALNGVSGSGLIESSVVGLVGLSPQPLDTYSYTYTIDLSGMSPTANHCVRLRIHFGTPESCEGPAVDGDPNQIQSAALAPYGDITLVFAGGCLHPGQASVSFSMLSQAGWKTNWVEVIDDYFNPVNGQTNETFYTVKAIVPDIPPDPMPWWVSLANLQHAVFQGQISYYDPTSSIPMLPVTNGDYDVRLRIVTTFSNGIPASETVTNRIRITQFGLFQIPLPGEPVEFGDGSARFLDVGFRPAGGSNDFTPLNPPLPITPAPQALYAFSSGTVADLVPGQAVTSLNGLTDAVNLQAGSGIVLETNGNTLTVSAQPGVASDKNLKTDFTNLKPEEILAKLAALRIQAWRYTNEVAGVRHVGPMAQDFKAAFGLGQDEKFIDFVDEEGVALAAIQGLNQKLDEKDAEIQTLKQQNETLEKRLDHLEQTLKSFADKN
jgi:hypothetical protein